MSPWPVNTINHNAQEGTMTTELDTRLPARLWVEEITDHSDVQDIQAHIEFEQGDDANEYALYTFVDGKGSVVSYYLDREAAIGLAARILKAVALT